MSETTAKDIPRHGAHPTTVAHQLSHEPVLRGVMLRRLLLVLGSALSMHAHENARHGVHEGFEGLRFGEWCIHCSTSAQIDKHADRHTDRQADKWTDGQIDR